MPYGHPSFPPRRLPSHVAREYFRSTAWSGWHSVLEEIKDTELSLIGEISRLRTELESLKKASADGGCPNG